MGKRPVSSGDRPASPATRSFKDELKDEETGQKYHSVFKAEAEEAARELTTFPATDIFETADLCLGVHAGVFEVEMKAASRRFSGDELARVEAAFKRLRPLNHAMYYSASRAAVQGVPVWKQPGVPKQVEEGYALADLGKQWLEPMVMHGRITQAEYAAVLAGKGRPDMIQDNINCGATLEENWDLVEHLLKAPRKKGQPVLPPITRAQVKRMRELGTELREKLDASKGKAPAGEVDWRQQVLGLFALLERDYDTVREAIAYHLRAEGRWAEADALASLRGLTRYGKPRPAKPEPAPEPGPEPTKPTEPVN